MSASIPYEDCYFEDVYSGCFRWIAYTKPDGYGWRYYKGRPHQAHRIAWQKAFGEIPDGLNVCHSCDNRGCVNPRHLFLGTQRDNVQDAVRKHRMIGTPPRLSHEDIQVIKQSPMRQAAIARSFGIHQCHVSRIRNGKRRKSRA